MPEYRRETAPDGRVFNRLVESEPRAEMAAELRGLRKPANGMSKPTVVRAGRSWLIREPSGFRLVELLPGD